MSGCKVTAQDSKFQLYLYYVRLEFFGFFRSVPGHTKTALTEITVGVMELIAGAFLLVLIIFFVSTSLIVVPIYSLVKVFLDQRKESCLRASRWHF